MNNIRAFATAVALLAAAPAYAQTAPTALCSDDSISYSAHFQGTCSRHGGVAVWDNEAMQDQANQWCDDNPVLCKNSHWMGIEGHGDHPLLKRKLYTPPTQAEDSARCARYYRATGYHADGCPGGRPLI
jgi:hypothetical protein